MQSDQHCLTFYTVNIRYSHYDNFPVSANNATAHQKRASALRTYTESKYTTRPTLSFYNFRKYGPILISFSLLHSQMKSGISYYVTCHLISNPLPNYLAKFERSNVQLYRTVIQFRNDAKSFIYSKYPQRCHVLDHISTVTNLQYYYGMCSKYPPTAHTHVFFSRARHRSRDTSTSRCSILRQAFNSRCQNSFALTLSQTTSTHSEDILAKRNPTNENTC